MEGGGGGGGGGVGLAGVSKTYVFEDHGVLGTRPVVVTDGWYRLAGRGGRSLGRVGLAILIGEAFGLEGYPHPLGEGAAPA